MIDNGHIELKHFGDFFSKLDYERPLDATRGLSYCNLADENRYKKEFVKACIHKGAAENVELYLQDHFSWLKKHSFAISLMEPGMILPLHTDKYGFYKKTYSISNSDSVCRIIIFLEDWKPGHISQVGNKLTPQWKAGDWICWTGETKHMAANLGHENRYVLQITGLLKT